MGDFSNDQTPVASKRHVCDVCFREIPKGERYARSTGRFGGDFYSVAMHYHCAKIFEAACSEHDAAAWEGTAFVQALEICQDEDLVEDVDGRWRLKLG